MNQIAKHAFRRLFEPLTIGNFTLRNRIVSTPHFSGLPPDRDLQYIEERARGGAGFFGLAAGSGVLEYGVGLGPEGLPGQWDARSPSPATSQGVAFYDDMVIPMLRERANLLHAHGAHGFGQVAHAGASNFRMSMNPLIGPSNVATPVDALTPHALSEDEVEELVFCFAHAIRRIAESGLDAAEIHGAHGYLVNQFLSPYYNRRDDKWGGSLEKRANFALAIIFEAKRLVGNDFPIGIRLGYEGRGEGPGITIDDLVANAKLLEPHVCHISVSGGNGPGIFKSFDVSYLSPWYREPAYNAAAAAAVRRAVKVPVIVTGRIADPALGESLLADGTADLIGMVRALIADPDLPNKAKSGNAGRQRMCLGLSECHHAGKYLTHVTCAVNAAAGRESEMVIVPATKPKTVVVVGAGPAGLEATRVAARRGHKVFLCDQAKELGGTVRILSTDPNRRNLLDHSVYFESELADLDVELVLGYPISADDVVGFGADAVVIATGGRPIIPDIAGIERDNVVFGLDVLRGTAVPGKRVLVVGGSNNHMAAPSIAEFLLDKGHEVQLISEQLDFASAVEDVTRYTLQQRLHCKRIFPQLATRLVAVDSGATLCDVLSGEERRVEEVTVVLACGLLPNDALYQELKGKVPELHVIGDAFSPRRIMHATVDGARLGHRL
jgi:2,4-dienoyl-CoA reductase-like NADH-dependent reductase (Old Yellow Enzyme family)/thioredoxin reductase